MSRNASRIRDIFIGLIIILVIAAGGILLALLLSGIPFGRREQAKNNLNNLVAPDSIYTTNSKVNIVEKLAQVSTHSYEIQERRPLSALTEALGIEQKTKRDLSADPSSVNSTTKPIAREFVVNQETKYNQEIPDVLALNGSFVIGWHSEGQDGSRLGVSKRYLSNQGEFISDDVQINTYTSSDQQRISLAAYGQSVNQTILQTWMSDGQDRSLDGIFAGSTNSSSFVSATGDVQVNEIFFDAQQGPLVSCSPYTVNPDCTIVFHSRTFGTYDTDGFAVVGQRYFSFPNKNGTNFLVNVNTIGDQSFANVVYTPNGRRFFSWTDSNPTSALGGDSYSIIGRYHDPATGFSSEFRINDVLAGIQTTSASTSSSRGDVAYTWWTDSTGTGLQYDVAGKVYSQNGSVIASEKVIPTISSGQQIHAFVTSLTKKMNGWLWLWASDDTGDYDVRVQFTAPNIDNIGREFVVNHHRLSSQYVPKAIELSDGNLAIVYQTWGLDGSNFGIACRILIPDIGLFFYNIDATKITPQNTEYLFTDLILNPAVDTNNVNVTLVVDPQVGQLNAPSFVTTRYGNVTSTYNVTSGTLNIYGANVAIGAPVAINDLLAQLKFMPASYVRGSVPIRLFAQAVGQPNSNSTLAIQVDPVNYAPVLTVQQFQIDQGTPLALTPSMFSASNPDPNVNRPISYEVSRVLQTRVADKKTGLDIFSFTDQDLASGNVILVPDESGIAPSFDITATDTVTGLSSNTTTANIFYNARPVINKNQLTINYKQTVIVGSNQFALNVTDDHTIAGNIMIYAQATDGSFMNGGVPVTSFTPRDIGLGGIVFATSGTNVPTKIRLTANDGRINSTESMTVVNFIPNTAPVVTTNLWSFSNNTKIQASLLNLNGTDDFTPWRELKAYVVKAEHCQFMDSSGREISSFTLGQLSDGLIGVSQDGSSNSPVMSFVLQDDQYNSTLSPGTVSFTFRTPPGVDTVQVDNRGAIGGAVAGGVAALLIAAGVGLFAKYRKDQARYAKEREGQPLANAVREKLGISNATNFNDPSDGKSFVNSIGRVEDLIGVKVEIDGEIEAAANSIANAIRQHKVQGISLLKNGKIDLLLLSGAVNEIAESIKNGIPLEDDKNSEPMQNMSPSSAL